MSTGYFLDVLEDGAFCLDEDEIFLVGGAWREEDALLAKGLVVIDDIIVDTFFEDEGVVPELDQVEHLGLYLIPIIAIRAQILEEVALSSQLHLETGTRFNRESTFFWKDSLLAA